MRPVTGFSRPFHSAAVKSGPTRLNFASAPLPDPWPISITNSRSSVFTCGAIFSKAALTLTALEADSPADGDQGFAHVGVRLGEIRRAKRQSRLEFNQGGGLMRFLHLAAPEQTVHFPVEGRQVGHEPKAEVLIVGGV